MAEYDINRIIGTKVRHIRFGTGAITGAEDNYICVDFGDLGIRRFRYPDAFEKFLEVESDDMRPQITSDLEARKEEDDYIEHKKSQENYDKVKAFGQKKAAEHEKKMKLQMEKQRRAKLMREQRMQGVEEKREEKREEKSNKK